MLRVVGERDVHREKPEARGALPALEAYPRGLLEDPAPVDTEATLPNGSLRVVFVGE